MSAVFSVALLSLAAAPNKAPWQVAITQMDQSNKAITDTVKVACPSSGCEQAVQLYVDFKLQPFLAGITFVDKGAYLALQPIAHDLGQAIDFQQGYRGPVFISVRPDEKDKTDILRFTLTGSAVPDSNRGSTAIMKNSDSLVFHRKLQPDLILRIELVRPSVAS